jgi:hypothetical protein
MVLRHVTLADLTVPPPPPGPADWNGEGVWSYEGLLADEAILGPYEDEWRAANGMGRHRPGGWPDACPYMRHPALLRLLCDERLADTLVAIMGHPMAVHLNLTGWVSTERDWHADTYLNPPAVGDDYLAVWISLASISPLSGPFQYVPGSHRWPQVTRELMGEHVNLSDPAWPKHSEDLLAPLITEEILDRGATVVNHLPNRGDVLFWHARLYHRGSRPQVPGMPRRALIAHFSGLTRSDFPAPVRHDAGGWYFPIQGTTPV